MKILTCADLGGPCDHKLRGATFEELGKAAYGHVMEKINAGDKAHAEAAAKMRNASPDEQKAMMAAYRNRFDEAPDL